MRTRVASSAGFSSPFCLLDKSRTGTSYAQMLVSKEALLLSADADAKAATAAGAAAAVGDGGAGVDVKSDPDAAAAAALAAAAAAAPAVAEDSIDDLYDPYFLDDANIQSGKHRVVMNLPGMMQSVISYVTAKDLKDELNQQFRNKVPAHSLPQRMCWLQLMWFPALTDARCSTNGLTHR